MAVAVAEGSMPVASVRRKSRTAGLYPSWFYIPAAIIFAVLFMLPTFASLFFSLTRWSLQKADFIGLDNFVQFFREPFLFQGLVNTLIYGAVTSALKVVLGMLLALLLTSDIFGRGYLRAVVFFPVLVSTVGVGITFTAMMHPTQGLINESLASIGIKGPGWLTDPRFALYSVALVDVWKGVGLATVIYIAGIVSIPLEYYEAARIDGATAWQRFWTVTLPLVHPATATVIILSFIGGLRSFDMIWSMTKGGPGFTSDVIASVIYKQYQAGFYGLSTAGNVVLFALVALLIVPLSMFLNSREVDRVRHARRYIVGGIAIAASVVVFLVPFAFIILTALKDRREAATRSFDWPTTWHLWDNFMEVMKTQDYQLVTAFINSIILTVASVTLLVVLGAMVGFVLQRRPSRWTPIVNFLVLAGLIIPPAVVPTIWVLQSIGMFKTMHGMILIEVAYGLSFTILLFRAFISTIPRELDEAAIIDGAGPIRLFFQVGVLPLLRPVMVTVIVVQSVAIFNDFTNPLYYLPGKQNVTVQLTLFNFQGQFNTSLHLLFMNILLITIPPLIVYLFFNRQIVAGMTAGAVKG